MTFLEFMGFLFCCLIVLLAGVAIIVHVLDFYESVVAKAEKAAMFEDAFNSLQTVAGELRAKLDEQAAELETYRQMSPYRGRVQSDDHEEWVARVLEQQDEGVRNATL